MSEDVIARRVRDGRRVVRGAGVSGRSAGWAGRLRGAGRATAAAPSVRVRGFGRVRSGGPRSVGGGCRAQCSSRPSGPRVRAPRRAPARSGLDQPRDTRGLARRGARRGRLRRRRPGERTAGEDVYFRAMWFITARSSSWCCRTIGKGSWTFRNSVSIRAARTCPVRPFGSMPTGAFTSCAADRVANRRHTARGHAIRRALARVRRAATTRDAR